MPDLPKDPNLPKDAKTLTNPDLIGFLPMIYVAWADGDLAPDEVRAICARVMEAMGADASCRDILGSWLNPERPPSAPDLQRLLGAIRAAASGLDRRQRRSLTRLGVELAEVSGRDLAAPELRALEDVERALGVVGSEAARQILVAERPVPETGDQVGAFDVAAMQRLLDGNRSEMRERVKQVLSQSEFRY